MQDPEIYLKERAIHVACAVHPEREARLDSAHRRRVNHETYFFSDDAALAEFDRDRLRYCGMLSDPVTQERFHPDERSPYTLFDGRPYYFASAETESAFAADPRSYAEPRRAMPPMPAVQPAGDSK
ncbi:MAG TPA: hypothetical protein VJS92_14660 [Candidatus Polarisedimenticolaceae bacterium]|nr:hypothetical protein [Candidatus Polarisedimenticolaceae bacterium]